MSNSLQIDLMSAMSPSSVPSEESGHTTGSDKSTPSSVSPLANPSQPRAYFKGTGKGLFPNQIKRNQKLQKNCINGITVCDIRRLARRGNLHQTIFCEAWSPQLDSTKWIGQSPATLISLYSASDVPKFNKLTSLLLGAGGVKRISSLVYDETRNVLRNYLSEVVGDIVKYTEHCKFNDWLREDSHFFLSSAVRKYCSFIIP